MTTFGFLIDNRKCIGCHACTIACKSEHDVPIGVDRTWVKYIEKGEFPNNRRMFSVMRCNHCDDSPCTTICPTTSLYRRDDGIVDFNSDRCIGCKACMQACPYDALHIDPVSNTAAKCNFCTHRLEAGLEPSCVVVCPEQAIVAGDLDNPNSEISKLVERHPVQVRKPEKGTKPKLVYIDADELSLVPTRTSAEGRTMWSRGEFTTSDGAIQIGAPEHNPAEYARRAYDVRPRRPAWGWPVAAYTWTKSIAAGAFLAVVAHATFGETDTSTAISTALAFVALLFLLVTTGLLIGDLKQPKRFLYILLRPQWKSWLVRGAVFLVGYGTVLSAWIAARLLDWPTITDLLMWPCAVLAVLSAVYTAFLFAQAKGRDLWQNPLLSIHLLAHATLAGSAVWLLLSYFIGEASADVPRFCTIGAVTFSLLSLLGEIFTTPPTEDARRAIDSIIGKPGAPLFWGIGIACGHVLPLLLLIPGNALGIPAALLVLGGMIAIEWLWVIAPQRIPLS